MHGSQPGRRCSISGPVASLVQGRRSLFLVGDPDQAIYGWRGAIPEQLGERLRTDYPDLKVCCFSAMGSRSHARLCWQGMGSWYAIDNSKAVCDQACSPLHPI